MLNNKGERELAYVVIVDGIEELPGYDRVESAIVGGWHCIVPKGQFEPGDPGIYFEIDSKVPADNPAFAFLEKRNYKIKTQKMCKSISQGLLMHAEDFGWKALPTVLSTENNDDAEACIVDEKGNRHYATGETRFLTNELGVTYAEVEDNERKAPSIDKYKKMAQRHPNIFKKPFVRWMMKYRCGRNLMFFFFGKKKDKKNGWPSWIHKTDEERIENMPWILKNKEPWIATEKIDGSSTTFAIKRNGLNRFKFYVCSRNVCFQDANEPCFYDNNVYFEMADKYNMFEILKAILHHEKCEWVIIQGETYGNKIRPNNYDMIGHDFAAFNLITSNKGRWNSVEMSKFLNSYNVPCVPILDDNFILPDTVEELRDYVNSQPSVINHKLKEGIVFRSQDGIQSFKCVSPEYLLKHHE